MSSNSVRPVLQRISRAARSLPMTCSAVSERSLRISSSAPAQGDLVGELVEVAAGLAALAVEAADRKAQLRNRADDLAGPGEHRKARQVQHDRGAHPGARVRRAGGQNAPSPGQRRSAPCARWRGLRGPRGPWPPRACRPGRTACTRRWSSSPIMMETVRSGLSSTAALSFADSSGEIRCSSTMTPRALRLRSDMRRRT